MTINLSKLWSAFLSGGGAAGITVVIDNLESAGDVPNLVHAAAALVGFLWGTYVHSRGLVDQKTQVVAKQAAQAGAKTVAAAKKKKPASDASDTVED